MRETAKEHGLAGKWMSRSPTSFEKRGVVIMLDSEEIIELSE